LKHIKTRIIAGNKHYQALSHLLKQRYISTH